MEQFMFLVELQILQVELFQIVKQQKKDGALCATGGSVELSGSGKIKECNSISGGAVYVSSGDTIISGGTIENCEATENGRSNMCNWWNYWIIWKW